MLAQWRFAKRKGKTLDVWTMPVHPAAEVFPMLPDDELDELAADIKANGLAHPLVVKDGVLIDGRNRREACKRAGVEPRTEELNGQDVTAYVLSSNIARRHLTKAQQAMAMAKIYPEPAKYKRGSNSLESKELKSGYLAQARAILKWCPEYVDNILNSRGQIKFDAAYKEAMDRKAAAGAPKAREAAIRKSDPDLADRIAEEQISLAEAEALAKSRRDDERKKRQGFYDFAELLQRWRFMLDDNNRAAFIAAINEYPDEVDVNAVIAELSAWSANIDATAEEMRK